MLSTLRRAVVAACVCAALVAAAGAPAASANMEYFHGNTGMQIAQGLPWAVGNPHALTESAASMYETACVGAIDYYGGSLASASYCGTFTLGTSGHQAFCGCITRDGAVFPYPGQTGWVFTAWETF